MGSGKLGRMRQSQLLGLWKCNRCEHGPKPTPIRAEHSLSRFPCLPQTKWTRHRTGTHDAVGGRGRSCGRGCADRAAAFPAPRRSMPAIPASPSPGDWSMVSAPTRSPLCGLLRFNGPRHSQKSVNESDEKKDLLQGCARMRPPTGPLFGGPFHAVLGVYRSLSLVPKGTKGGHFVAGTAVHLPPTGRNQ